MKSPYASKDPSGWRDVTERLLGQFPLPMKELVEVVLSSWEDIFHSRIGAKAYQIGKDIWPEPQIVGFLLHELIPLNLQVTYPGLWKRGLASTEFDAVYLPDDTKSFEIKTSSSASGIFGNRIYTHLSTKAGKRRGSYFLTVNFQKFGAPGAARPEISLIRFGWLGTGDWVGQKAESGQQSRLTKEAKAFKLKIIYEQKPARTT